MLTHVTWKRGVVVGVMVVAIMLLMPLSVAAIVNTEVVDILNAVLAENTKALGKTLDANTEALKIAYCAAAISVLCP